jgi:hypothetical protein
MEDNLEKRPIKPSAKIKEIDRDLVWRLACMQSTVKEIADVVGVSEDSIKRHFADLIEKGKSVGKKSLRRAQFEKALNGDARMLVWLGRQYLSQKDSPESAEDNGPLPWNEE